MIRMVSNRARAARLARASCGANAASTPARWFRRPRLEARLERGTAMLVGEALNDEIAHRLVDVVKGADSFRDVAGGRLPERDAARRHVVERFVDELFLAAVNRRTWIFFEKPCGHGTRSAARATHPSVRRHRRNDARTAARRTRHEPARIAHLIEIARLREPTTIAGWSRSSPSETTRIWAI